MWKVVVNKFYKNKREFINGAVLYIFDIFTVMIKAFKICIIYI